MKEWGSRHRAGERVTGTRLVCALAVLTLCTMSAAAPAQPVSEPMTAAATMEATDAPADLVVANRQIVTLRGSVMGATPHDRVAAITDRLRALFDRGGAIAVGMTE